MTTNNNCRVVCDPVPDPCYVPPQEDEEECEDEELTEEVKEKEGKEIEKEDKEEEEEKPKKKEKKQRRSHKKTHRHHHHPHDERRVEEPQAYAEPQKIPTESQPALLKTPENDPGLVQCDCVAALILCVYAIAIAVLTIGVSVYVQDSKWNDAVDAVRGLPKAMGSDESLFTGKRLFFAPTVEGMDKAKEQLHRGSRPFELGHLIFYSIFVVITLFQCPLYITRGNTSQYKCLCFYYGIFGMLALAISCFPLLSWNVHFDQDKEAVVTLTKISQMAPRHGPPDWKHLPNEATIFDADLLTKIMDYCVTANSGEASNNDSLVIYATEYHFHHLQAFGFCGNYRDRLIITILGYLFALFCLIIPCASSMESRSPAKVVDGSVEEGQTMKGDDGAVVEQPVLPLSVYTKEGGEPLTPEELKHLQSFSNYVVQPPQDNMNMRQSF